MWLLGRKKAKEREPGYGSDLWARATKQGAGKELMEMQEADTPTEYVRGWLDGLERRVTIGGCSFDLDR